MSEEILGGFEHLTNFDARYLIPRQFLNFAFILGCRGICHLETFNPTDAEIDAVVDQAIPVKECVVSPAHVAKLELDASKSDPYYRPNL